VVGVTPDEVIFTSGATESNNLALLGLAEHGLATGKTHIVTSLIEHKAVLEPLERLSKKDLRFRSSRPTSSEASAPKRSSEL